MAPGRVGLSCLLRWGDCGALRGSCAPPVGGWEASLELHASWASEMPPSESRLFSGVSLGPDAWGPEAKATHGARCCSPPRQPQWVGMSSDGPASTHDLSGEPTATEWPLEGPAQAPYGLLALRLICVRAGGRQMQQWIKTVFANRDYSPLRS